MRYSADVLLSNLETDLVRAGWDGATSPYPGQTVKQYAMMAQRNSLLKKFRPKDTSAQDKAALDLFLSCNEKCRAVWPDTSSISEIETIALGEAKNFIYDFFHDEGFCILTWSSIRQGFNFGPGANIGATGTDFLSKVGASDMASTNPLLLAFWQEYVKSAGLWTDVEKVRSATLRSSHVRGSRLSFVPKSAKISRTICTEPLLNMLFQKGVESVLRSRLERVCGITLENQQERNRQLALIGSKTGRFGTIDLSSASDTVSLSLVEWLLPPEVFFILKSCSCRVTSLPGGSEVDLQMLSSMGNAFTFPLQTIIFASVVMGVYRALGLKTYRPSARSLGNYAVFGDDIIVEREAYGLVCKMISRFGFQVNHDKSFNEGLFRESCGRDWYCGHDVRGVYIQSLATSNDVYSAINRLNRWSAEHGVLLPTTIGYLLRQERFIPVPMHETDVAGVKVPARMLTRIRRNRYGQLEYRCRVPVPTSYNVANGVTVARGYRASKFLSTNPSAVLLAAIAGTLRRGRVVLRSTDERTPMRLQVRYSSCWDYAGPTDALFERRCGDRWKSFFELNLAL